MARRVHGGRFNARGVPALYLSLDWSTAVVEASQGLRLPHSASHHRHLRGGLRRYRRLDRCRRAETPGRKTRRSGLRLEAPRRDRPARAILGLAERLRAADVVGIIVPSLAVGAAAGAKNLVLWRWSNEIPHKVTVFDPGGRLPRDELVLATIGLEATPGIEPGCADLQSAASPLRHVALCGPACITRRFGVAMAGRRHAFCGSCLRQGGPRRPWRRRRRLG